MNIYKHDIVFQEVPNHISLALYVCGCSLRCPGCHSPELWSESNGYELTRELFLSLLNQYRNRITCVLFLGGEWREAQLVEFLKTAHHEGFWTARYTGETGVSQELESHLDFLKTGRWRRELGGLDSPTTNQVFRDIKNNQILNHLFYQTHNKETAK